MSGADDLPPRSRSNKFPMSLDRLSAPKVRLVEPADKPRASGAPTPASRAVAPKMASVPKPVSQSTSSARAPLARPAPGSTLRPQAPLHHAEQYAKQHAEARSVTSRNLGLDSTAVRQRMVSRLRQIGICDEVVLGAMGSVARHLFVDAALAAQAYEDTSLPIGLNQTISKPSVVARMIELLRSGANARTNQTLGRVLEIGTGCGYQAAVLSLLSKSVMSVERLKPLHEKARELLAPIRNAPGAGRSADIRLIYGDGMLGHAPNAPYDSIISAAGGERLPQTWLDQLAVGGRLVAPLHDVLHGGQVLVVIDRTEAGFERVIHESVHFVPLKSGVD